MVGPGTFLWRMARIVTRVNVVDAHNLDILDQPGPAMIIINHTTVVDVIVTVGNLHKLGFTTDGPCEGACTHRRHIRPLGTSDMWDFPVARQVCTGSGIIPVDQHDGRPALKAAREAIRNGECVLIYPEGDVKINAEASPRDFRPGAAGLAKAGDVTVVPIAQHDSRKLGNGSVLRSIVMAFAAVFRRPKIEMRVGTPVLPAALADLTHPEVNTLLEERLRLTWRAIPK